MRVIVQRLRKFALMALRSDLELLRPLQISRRGAAIPTGEHTSPRIFWAALLDGCSRDVLAVYLWLRSMSVSLIAFRGLRLRMV